MDSRMDKKPMTTPDDHDYKDAWLETVADLNNTAAALNHLKDNPLALLEALSTLLEAEALNAFELELKAADGVVVAETANERQRLMTAYRPIHRRHINAEYLKRKVAQLRFEIENYSRHKENSE